MGALVPAAAAARGAHQQPGRRPEELEPLRCSHCRRLLAKVALAPGTILEMRCKRCGTIQVLTIERS